MKKLIEEYEDKRNIILDYYDKLHNSYEDLKAKFIDLAEEYDALEEDYQSLQDVVSKHGLDWWEGMPALRITDSEKANKWFQHALAYYAEWDRVRVEGPISQTKNSKQVSEELKRIHDDFCAHYREDDFSESETPPAGPASE